MTLLGRAAIVALVVVNLLNAYAIVAGPREDQNGWYLMVTETGPATWLSVMVLAGTALLSAVCSQLDEARRTRFWAVLAVGLAAMSLDDQAEVHERVGGNVASALGDSSGLSHLWVVPWALVGAVVAVVLWRMRPRLPRSLALWLGVGLGVSVVSSVAFEVLATNTVNKGAGDTAKLALYTVEENLEVIGILIVAWAIARHIKTTCLHVSPGSRAVQETRGRLGTPP